MNLKNIMSNKNIEALEQDAFVKEFNSKAENIMSNKNSHNFSMNNDSFEIKFKVIKRKNVIYYKVIEELIINQKNILNVNNILNNQKYYVLKISEVVEGFKTRRQHFINQEFLKNWKIENKIPFYDFRKQTHENRNTDSIFHDRFLYRYICKNKIWYIEDGIIKITEKEVVDFFNNLLIDLRNTHYVPFDGEEFYKNIIFTMLRGKNFNYLEWHNMITDYLLENTENDKYKENIKLKDFLNSFFGNTVLNLIQDEDDELKDIRYQHFKIEFQKTINFIPLKNNFISFHVNKEPNNSHKKIDSTFLFIPVSKSEAFFVYHKREHEKIKKIMCSKNNEMFYLIEYYLSGEKNKNEGGIIINNPNILGQINLDNIN